MNESDQLVGAHAAARLVGISHQRLAVLRKRDEFPEPAVVLENDPAGLRPRALCYWHLADILEWDRKRNHRPGRIPTPVSTSRRRGNNVKRVSEQS